MEVSMTRLLPVLTVAMPAFLAFAGASPAALAWGDVGHEVVGLVAQANLNPKATAEVARLFATDHDAFKMRDGHMTSDAFERQATWADYYRDAERTGGKTPEQIHSYFWHFVDIELNGGSLENACFGFPQPAPDVPASRGPDPDCVVNKIEQFAAELGSPGTPDAEKLLALKFLMHFVGDLHQPLHSSDNLDHGGNDEQATVGTTTGALHFHWDVTFVQMIGAATGSQNTDPAAIVAALREPSDLEKQQWLGPLAPRIWALETYHLAQSYAYNLPAPTTKNNKPVYVLSTSYAKSAVTVASDQLLKAGYRLAAVLNATIGR
jgi:hypothetical protein